MRIITREVKDQPLTVTIEYPEYTESTASIIHKIKSMDISLSAGIGDQKIRIDLSDIYYIENVDRKLFIYTKKDVYRYDSTMSEVESLLGDTNMVRISRTCIMNTDHLKEIRQIKNSRLEALMDNEEKLMVSRKYLQNIKKVFGGK